MNLLKKAAAFLFDYKFIKPFAFLRIAVALSCLLFFVCTANDLHQTIGLNGFTGSVITEASVNEKLVPKISWLAYPLMKVGCTDEQAIIIFAVLYVTAILFMLVGLFTRLGIFMVWILHLMLCYSNRYFYSYGFDDYTTIALFYCLLMPTGNYFSLDNWRLKTRKKPDPVYESFLMRALQLQLCIAYFFEGFFKMIMPGWLSGTSIWQTLIVPRFSLIDFSFLIHYAFALKLLGWIVVLLELLYPLMMAFSKTRKPWFTAIVVMHIFIAIFLKLPFFGLIMIVLNVAAFGWNEFYPIVSRLSKRQFSEYQHL